MTQNLYYSVLDGALLLERLDQEHTVWPRAEGRRYHRCRPIVEGGALLHIGLMMECDYREGQTQEEAFDDAFATAADAETWGFDRIWLAERHFAPSGSGRAIPSVVASPLIFATAIAARTTRLRVGTAVLVLLLGHPVRMAEEVATLDHISRGRLELGIGRSGFPWAYEGYGIPYAESWERFREYFDVMQLAWTQERFSYQGKHYN